MSSDAPPRLGLVALWLVATATLATPLALAWLAPPSDLVSVPFAALSTPALAVAAATVAFVALAVVVGVARLGGPDGHWGDRITSAAIVAAAVSFLATTAFTPPDPVTQVVYGGPAIGVALLAAHIAVAFDVDERVRALG